ncbi:hypothetical protein RB608_02200 [Nocardioides sp. LHD-245]|uniref:hypothetical protein n=1 Tax=Nocardioides sp. LHD-245 TaxID=3051387 RepID=UPI0027E17457|nr:hypothetical protein [Nocardioides sp. LHD-245]
MSREPDGLDEFEESALVRALRAPGTLEELAGEERFVAAFRRARRSPVRGGRVIGRIGVSGAALLAAVTLTGGVAAAAYTQRLPHSVQAIAHDAFGGVGVPPERAVATPPEPRTARPAPEPSASEQAGARRSPSAARSPRAGDRDSPAVESSVETAPGDAVDTAAPDPSGSASESAGTATDPTTDPTSDTSSDTAPSGPSTTPPDPPVTVPTSVSVTTSVRRVVTGGRASVTGLVLDDGEPVVGEQVDLFQRSAAGRWSEIASAVTGADGAATFATGSLAENAFFRIRVEVDTDGDDEPDRVLQSRKRRIGVQPALTLSATGPVVSVHTLGAGPGDAFTVSRRATDGRLVRIGIRQIDDQGGASIDLSSYTGRVRILVRVLRTSTHTAVKRWVTVRVPREPKAPQTPTPTPSSTPSSSPSAEPSGSAGRSTTTGS